MADFFNFLFKAAKLFLTFSDKAYGVIPLSGQKPRKYLITLSKSNRWVFSKGHALIGENEVAAAKRELKEETGVVVENIIPGISLNQDYTFKLWEFLPINKKVVFFVGQAKNMTVTVDHKEVKDFKWVTLDEGLKMLTFENSKKVLTEVDVILSEAKDLK